MYHATKTQNVESILEHGLDPNRGGSGASAMDEKLKGHSKNKVHVTKSLDTGRAYVEQLQGGTPFGKDKVDPSPAPAEILEVSLPNTVEETLNNDPDSDRTDKAYTTTEAIDPLAIRKTEPNQIEKPVGKDAVNADQQMFLDIVHRCDFSNNAFLSNMSQEAKDKINELHNDKQNKLDKKAILQSLKQGMRSVKIDYILSYDELREIKALYRSNHTPTGVYVFDDPPRNQDS